MTETWQKDLICGYNVLNVVGCDWLSIVAGKPVAGKYCLLSVPNVSPTTLDKASWILYSITELSSITFYCNSPH